MNLLGFEDTQQNRAVFSVDENFIGEGKHILEDEVDVNWNLQGIIGNGKYGIVRKGLYKNNCVAIKFAFDKLQFYDMILETRYSCKLHNENIIETYGLCLFSLNGRVYPGIVMELGVESVEEYISKSDDPVEITLVNNVCLNIARALVYMHSLNMVHKDIRLRNFVMFENNIKLIDFGSTLHVPEKSMALPHWIGEDTWNYGFCMIGLSIYPEELVHPSKVSACEEYFTWREEVMYLSVDDILLETLSTVTSKRPSMSSIVEHFTK